MTTLLSSRRVLIHAASGGVGLAALQLAAALGASAAATAGAAGKRVLLRRSGQQIVTSSRDLSFVDDCPLVRTPSIVGLSPAVLCIHW